MNFMSGRSGICEEITASTGIISMSSTSSPSSPSSSLQPYIHQYNNRRRHHHHREEAEVAGGLDRDDHMLANSSTARPTVLVMEREHMFDKVVTPSDVGKLNRLVIPKHHAEKYFPLDPTSNEKGLLLNFEDRNGKPWRFRYSYWNSSQSYVMTKGWSRFVKEKKLDAGDIVSFQRGLGDLGKDRLFIDWRRRPDAPLDHHLPSIIIPSNINIPYYDFSNYNYPMRSIHSWNSTFSLQPSVQSSNVFSHLLDHHHPQGSTVYLNSGLQGAAGRSGGGGVLIPQHLGMVEEQRRCGVVFESVPVVQGKAAAKRLRLFGVNMDCPISESDHENDMMLNTTTTTTTTTSTQPQYYSKRPLHLMPLPPPFDSSSSNSFPSLQLQSNYNSHADHDKGKGSTSLDLDI